MEDPINSFDLDGTCARVHENGGECAGQKHGHWRNWRKRSNKNRAIFMKFNSKVAAAKFLTYLTENPMYLDNLLEKTGRWKEEEFRELQRKLERQWHRRTLQRIPTVGILARQ